MAPSVRLVPFGPAATTALVDAVRTAKAADPLARVTVAVPSAYVGITARRAVATELGGLVDVHVVPLAAVVEALGAPRLTTRGARPATRALRAAALRRALGDSERFRSVAHHPATHERLARTVAEVRAAGPDATARLHQLGGPAAAVAQLVDGTRATLGAFYDDADLAEAALDALAAGDAAVAALGALVVHLPRPPDPVTVAVLRALVRHADARVHLGITGDPEVDEATVELATRLGPYALDAAGPPSAVRIVGAPDPASEVAAALRTIAAALDAGTPLHRTAIAYRLDTPYARIITEAVAQAGWHWSGPTPDTLGDTIAGRALVNLLALVEHDFPRDAFAAFLAAAPVRAAAGGDEAPAHRWDVLTREAGIVAGAAQWRDRLAAHRARLGTERDARSARDDASEATLARLDAERREVERIEAFLDWLVDLTTVPTAPTWTRLAAWTHHLLDALLATDGWPDAEVRARDDLLTRLDGLGALDALAGPPPSLDEFRRALADELATPLGPTGRVGDGLLVLPLATAVGLDLDLVVVVGANEGRFPPRGTDDPLLTDRVRTEVGSLVTRGERRRRETLQRHAVLAAAPEVVVTWARSDPRAGRELHPARWVVDLARATLDRPVTAHDVATASDGAVTTIASPAALLAAGPGAPESLAAFDLASLAHHAPAIDDHPAVRTPPRQARALAALRARAGAALTAYDGYVGPLGDLLPDPSRALPPTALEHWATCPRRYAFERILRVGAVERPESIDDISAADRGTLVHRILERFVGEHLGAIEPDQPWSTVDRERLHAIATEEFAAAERAGATGTALLWKLSQRRIRATLDRWLTDDAAVRQERGLVPTAVELEFGAPAGAPTDGTEPDPAVLVAVAGREFRLRGKVDRVDRSPDGDTVAVYDYKTGSAKPYVAIQPKTKRTGPFDPTLGGTALQLPVYALAARQRHPDATSVEAAYWFVSGSDPGRRIGYPLDERHETEFRRVLGHIADGIEGGVFPANPGDDSFFGFDHCRTCAFDRVCPRDRDVQWDHKLDDPALDAYRALTPELPNPDPGSAE